MQCCGRGRASRIDREARSREPQKLGDSIGETETFPTTVNAPTCCSDLIGKSTVALIHVSDENPCGWIYLWAKPTCVLDRMPCGFQQETQLGIHVLSFTGGNPKKLWIETGNIWKQRRKIGGVGLKISDEVLTGNWNSCYSALGMEQGIPKRITAQPGGGLDADAYDGNVIFGSHSIEKILLTSNNRSI